MIIMAKNEFSYHTTQNKSKKVLKGVCAEKFKVVKGQYILCVYKEKNENNLQEIVCKINRQTNQTAHPRKLKFRKNKKKRNRFIIKK